VALFLVGYVVYKVLPLQEFKFRKEIRKLQQSDKKLWQQNLLYIYYFFSHFVTSREILYYVFYILFAILGYWNPLFSAILLLDIFKRFPVARQIVMAVEKPFDQILVTLIIFLMFTYFYTLIVFFNYYSDKDISIERKVNVPYAIDALFGHDEYFVDYHDETAKQFTCNELLSCFIFIFDQTFK
jgi:hypothetical protein